MEFDLQRRRFGQSPFVEEAEYHYAMGFYYMSPPANRDQTSTHMAITSINEYLQRYPNSLKKQLCLIRLDELQQTLAPRQIVHQRTDVLQDEAGGYKSSGRRPAGNARSGSTPKHTAPGGDTLPHREIIATNWRPTRSMRWKRTVTSICWTLLIHVRFRNFPESGYRRELDRFRETAAREYLDKHQSEATE